MRARYSLRAQAHLFNIQSYLSTRNPRAAQRVAARIRETTENLASVPEMDAGGVVAGTREMVVRGLPYVIVYEVRRQDDDVIVLGIFHGAQRR